MKARGAIPAPPSTSRPRKIHNYKSQPYRMTVSVISPPIVKAQKTRKHKSLAKVLRKRVDDWPSRRFPVASACSHKSTVHVWLAWCTASCLLKVLPQVRDTSASEGSGSTKLDPLSPSVLLKSKQKLTSSPPPSHLGDPFQQPCTSSNMPPWDAYLSLSEKERVSAEKVSVVLPAMLQVLQLGGQEPPPETRRKLLSHLLASLSLSSGPSSSIPTFNPSSPPAVLLPTIALIKLLGRSPAGSEELAREPGLKTLLAYGGLSRVATTLPPRRRQKPNQGLGITEIDSDDEDEDSVTPAEDEKDPLSLSESEALRCLCNTLTLHPAARERFPITVTENQDWVRGMVRLLSVTGAAFLAGRLLFLLTSKPGELVTDLTERGDVVESLQDYSTRYIVRLRSSDFVTLSTGPAPNATDILREHFKFAYNLMLQYSRQPARPGRNSSDSPALSLSPPTGDHDDSELSDSHTDEPGSESRPTSPLPNNGTSPDDKAPAGGKKKHFWTKGGKEDETSTSTSPPKPSMTELAPRRSKSPKLLARRLKSAVTGSSSSKPTAVPPVPDNPLTTPADGAPTGELSLAAASHFLPLFQPYLCLACLLPLGGPSNADPKDPSPLVRSALHTLLNFPIQLEELDGYSSSWLQPVSGARIAYPSLPPLPSRLLELLNKTCDAWFPVNVLPKDKKGRQVIPAHPDDLIPKGVGESGRAEEILGPLVLLLRKVSMLSEPATAMRELLLPDNIDRTIVLERRPDLIGHLIRLMSSILLPNTAYGVGEFLYNLCERDPTIFSTTIGYGNASGFLQNRGELIPPPSMPDRSPKLKQSNGPTSSRERPGVSRRVNPITGAYDIPVDNDEPQMTEEEKEREAERLYVLFDRMGKTGVMNVENPVQKARQEGRFQETSEEEENSLARIKAEDEKEEQEVEDELRRYKERKRAGTAPSVP
ncbi:hypothetical protein P7C70_g501, partial [Phenoliferia sp. Uapishka_3]